MENQLNFHTETRTCCFLRPHSAIWSSGGWWRAVGISGLGHVLGCIFGHPCYTASSHAQGRRGRFGRVVKGSINEGEQGQPPYQCQPQCSAWWHLGWACAVVLAFPVVATSFVPLQEAQKPLHCFSQMLLWGYFEVPNGRCYCWDGQWQGKLTERQIISLIRCPL